MSPIKPHTLFVAVTNQQSNSTTPAIKGKLAELEKEIERFRSENSKLAKLKKEREGVLSVLMEVLDSWLLDPGSCGWEIRYRDGHWARA